MLNAASSTASAEANGTASELTVALGSAESRAVPGMGANSDERRGAEAFDQEGCEVVGDLLRRGRPLRIEPARNPVHRAEQREGEQLRVATAERARAHTFFEHFANAAVELIATNDDRFQVRRRQRLEIEEERRAVQFVEDRVHEGDDQAPDFLVGRKPTVLDLLEQLNQAIERVLVAGEEDVFLVLEVVVEIALLHVERGRDLFDGRAVVTELAKGLRCALEDVDAG